MVKRPVVEGDGGGSGRVVTSESGIDVYKHHRVSSGQPIVKICTRFLYIWPTFVITDMNNNTSHSTSLVSLLCILPCVTLYVGTVSAISTSLVSTPLGQHIHKNKYTSVLVCFS